MWGPYQSDRSLFLARNAILFDCPYFYTRVSSKLIRTPAFGDPSKHSPIRVQAPAPDMFLNILIIHGV